MDKVDREVQEELLGFMAKARKAFLRDTQFRSEHLGPPPEFELADGNTQPQNFEPQNQDSEQPPPKDTPTAPTEVKIETPEEAPTRTNTGTKH